MKRSFLSLILLFQGIIGFSQTQPEWLRVLNASVVKKTSENGTETGVAVAPRQVVFVLKPFLNTPLQNLTNYDNTENPILGYTTANIENNFVVLKVANPLQGYLTVATKKIEPGEKVYFLSKNSLGQTQLSEGMVNSFKNFGPTQLIEVAAPSAIPANGLPLVNTSGELIGVSIVSPIKDDPSFYFIPSTLIAAHIAQDTLVKPLLDLINSEESQDFGSMQNKDNREVAEDFMEKGVNKMMQKEYQAAIEKFNQSIRLNPKNPDAYAFRGQAKCMLLMYKEAIDDFNKALELEPDYAEAYDMRGVCKGELGDITGACEDWTSAYEKGYNPALKLLVRFCNPEKK